MTIVISSDFEHISSIKRPDISWISKGQALSEDIRALRIGILNIMPMEEEYEISILRPFGRTLMQIEPVWIKLKSREYPNSDMGHLEKYYYNFEEVIKKKHLDGLILTGESEKGIPLRELPYWSELERILRYAKNNIANTLGICWGAHAIASFLGIKCNELQSYRFGIYGVRNLDTTHYAMCAMDDIFYTPYSSGLGINNSDMENADREGIIKLLAFSDDVGYVLAESSDKRFLMHFGHPEYEPSKIIDQYNAEYKKNKNTVVAPTGFDINNPVNNWRGHRNALFSMWIKNIHEQTLF